MSGIKSESEIGSSLRAVGLGEGGNEVKLLPDLNAALESCENELLKALYQSKEARHQRHEQHLRTTSGHSNKPSKDRQIPASPPSTNSSSTAVGFASVNPSFSSPRANHLHVAATKTLDSAQNHLSSHAKWNNFREPLRLILQTFQGLTDRNEDFWFRAVPYFTRRHFPAGTVLFTRGDVAESFYLLEEGILRAEYSLPQGAFWESMVAGTTCGELPFFGETVRSATVVAERDSICWEMDSASWAKLKEKDIDVAQEILRVTLKLTSERMAAITSYVLTTAG